MSEKKLPNKATYTMGTPGGEKTPRIQKNQTGTDLRSRPCQNAGASKQN